MNFFLILGSTKSRYLVPVKSKKIICVKKTNIKSLPSDSNSDLDDDVEDEVEDEYRQEEESNEDTEESVNHVELGVFAVEVRSNRFNFLRA